VSHVEYIAKPKALSFSLSLSLATNGTTPSSSLTAPATMLPDFAASSTSRPDTQETAAYAASQPLFDVLRGAISRLDDQKVHLTGAKDTVQHIHVKIPQEHIENNGTLPADYKDALIAAWKSTTESYVRIFEQLCELTGPDPAAGRQAEASYTGFQKLLYTAEAARTVAFEQDEEITQAKRKAEGSSDSDSSAPSTTTPNTPNKKAKRKVGESNESESSASLKATTSNKKAKPSPAEVASTKRTAEPSPSQAVQRPVKRQRTEDASIPEEKPTSQASEPATINTVQRLKPKQVRKERKRRNQQRQQEEVQQQATMPPPTIHEPQQPVAEAQYQDVNAEVDARLRAKEEAKKAKKEAKKRKRDSSASHIIEAEPGAEREATEAKAKALAQKPAKKRFKSENGEAVCADAAKSQPQKGKRGSDEANGQAAADEDVGGARRSKRTKTKK
jgi:hypothetical protein